MTCCFHAAEAAHLRDELARLRRLFAEAHALTAPQTMLAAPPEPPPGTRYVWADGPQVGTVAWERDAGGWDCRRGGCVVCPEPWGRVVAWLERHGDGVRRELAEERAGVAA